jgi:hypothetical protein
MPTVIKGSGDSTFGGTIQTTGIDDNATSNAITIDSSENVGIGTSSPGANLDVSTSIGCTIRLSSEYDYGPNRDWRFITNNFGATNWGGFSLEKSSTQQGNPNVTMFGIDGAGNCGIGIGGPAGATQPAAKLDVGGTIRSSTGILFGTDTAAANALDDYEEGTWTPTVVSDTGGTGTLLTSGPSTYTKIGRTVFFQAYVYSINLSAITSGKVQFDGLPFSGSGYSAISPTYNNTNATGLFASSGTKLRVEKDGTYLYYNTFTGNKMMIAGVYTTA